MNMASTLKKAIEGIIECPLCHERFKDAIVLKCGHSFCRNCLKTNISRGTCPHVCPCCRERLTQRERIMHRLTPALMIQSINDALADNAEPEPSEKTVMCRKHPQNEQKYTCEGCRKVVCSECIVGEHWQHSVSRPKNLADIKQEVKRLIRESKTWMAEKASYDKTLKEMKFMRTRARQALVFTDGDIRQAYEEFKSCVIRKRKQMASHISKARRRLTEQEKTLAIEQEEVRKRAAIISKVQQDLEEALQKGRPKDIFRAYRSCSEYFKELSYPVPSLSAVDKELCDLVTLAFWVPNPCGQPNASFGQLTSRGQPLKCDEYVDSDGADESDSNDDSWYTYNGDSEEEFENDIAESEGEEEEEEENGDNNDDDVDENNEEDGANINESVRNESVNNTEDANDQNANHVNVESENNGDLGAENTTNKVDGAEHDEKDVNGGNESINNDGNDVENENPESTNAAEGAGHNGK